MSENKTIYQLPQLGLLTYVEELKKDDILVHRGSKNTYFKIVGFSSRFNMRETNVINIDKIKNRDSQSILINADDVNTGESIWFYYNGFDARSGISDINIYRPVEELGFKYIGEYDILNISTNLNGYASDSCCKQVYIETDKPTPPDNKDLIYGGRSTVNVWKNEDGDLGFFGYKNMFCRISDWDGSLSNEILK